MNEKIYIIALITFLMLQRIVVVVVVVAIVYVFNCCINFF